MLDPSADVTRVAVFVDYQNFYKGARSAFGWKHHHYTYGQVYPRHLALRLVDRRRDADPKRQLQYVKVFRGEPLTDYDPKGQAACQRQVEYWNNQAAVEAFTRPLKYYPKGMNAGKRLYEPREKGIDVLLGLSMVMGAMRNEYDVAVLCSRDTDLVPAVEAVLDLGKQCEVAAWNSKASNSRLWIPGRSVWAHFLRERDYRIVCDPTDYTHPQPGGVASVPQAPSPASS